MNGSNSSFDLSVRSSLSLPIMQCDGTRQCCYIPSLQYSKTSLWDEYLLVTSFRNEWKKNADS